MRVGFGSNTTQIVAEVEDVFSVGEDSWDMVICSWAEFWDESVGQQGLCDIGDVMAGYASSAC